MTKPPTAISDDLVVAKARHLRNRIDKLLGELSIPGMRESALRRLRTVIVPEERARYEQGLAAQAEWVAALQERNVIRLFFRRDLVVVKAFRSHLKKHFKSDETGPADFKVMMNAYLDDHPDAVHVGSLFLSKGWTWKAAMTLVSTEPRDWLLDAMANELSISSTTMEKILTEKIHPGRRYKSLRRSRLAVSP